MNHTPRKRFGQHFLHDPAAQRRIVAAVDPRPGEALIEIGPGLGALTRHLLPRAGRLEVIELDRDVIPQLRERCAGLGELVVHAQDVLRFDFCPPPPGQRWRVIGNLPYNISTPLLFHLAAQAHCLQDLTVMLQREVAQRIAAAPSGAEYGRLSVMLAWHFRHELLFDLGPGAFQPPPKVWSSVLRLVPHTRPPAALDDPAWLGRVVTAAFGQRRKTLRNALAPLLDAPAIAAAAVDPGARAETLDLAAFARLANAARRAAGAC